MKFLVPLSGLFTFFAHLVCAQEIDYLQKLIDENQHQMLIEVTDSLIQADQGSAKLYFLQGQAFYGLKDNRKSLMSYLKALDVNEFSELPDEALELETLGNVAYTYGELGLYEKSLEYGQRQYELAIKNKDTTELATASYSIAIGLIKLGKSIEGLNYLTQTYNLDVAAKDTSAIGFDLNALGFAHLEAGFPEKALEYYQKSIDLLRRSQGSRNSLSTRLNNLGRAYLELNNYDSATYYYKYAYEVSLSLGDSINAAERLISLGGMENRRKNYPGALEYLIRAEEFFGTFEEGEQLTKCHLQMAQTYMGLGLFAKSANLVNRVLESSSVSTDAGRLSQSYGLLSEIYERAGNWKQALIASNEARRFEDSLSLQETNRALVEMQVKYEVDNMIQENELLKVESELSNAKLEIAERERLALWIGILVLVIGSSVAVIVIYQRQQLQKSLYVREVENLRLQVSALVGKGNGNSEEVSIELLNAKVMTPLSEREFEILASALKGNNNTQIAEELFVSVNTVKFHLKNVYDKLGVSSRNEALQFVIKQG